MRAHVLYWFRQVHLYLGVFTAPAILFFAFTGALQTLNLNDRSPDGSYTPPHWVSVLAQIHKKQSAQLPPQRRPGPSEGAAAPRQQKAQLAVEVQPAPAAQSPPKALPPGKPQQTAYQAQPKPFALKAFFMLVCVSLFASTLTGACMAWKLRRHKLVLLAILLAGIVLPLTMMKF